MDIIYYHNGCPDGWCAAYIAKKKYPDAELVPLNHGLDGMAIDALITKCEGKDVLMVDYSLRTRPDNDQLNRAAKSFRIFDHHKTAQAVLEGAPYATFDMKRSGAGLAWDYLFGKDSNGRGAIDDGVTAVFYQPRPWWVDYTEDQDLWNWVLPNSQKINAFLMIQPRTVDHWNWIIQLSREDAIQQGAGARQYIEYYTRSVVAEAQEGVFFFEDEGYRTAVLNIPYAGVSEAGNALCKNGYEIGLAWFERGDGQIQFSLRSEGDVDVSAIAKHFGGGGHMHAAGFQTSITEGRRIVDGLLGRDKGWDYVTPRCS